MNYQGRIGQYHQERPGDSQPEHFNSTHRRTDQNRYLTRTRGTL